MYPKDEMMQFILQPCRRISLRHCDCRLHLERHQPQSSSESYILVNISQLINTVSKYLIMTWMFVPYFEGSTSGRPICEGDGQPERGLPPPDVRVPAKRARKGEDIRIFTDSHLGIHLKCLKSRLHFTPRYINSITI